MKKNVFYLIYLGIVVFTLIEISLRIAGYRPGVYEDFGAEKVDSLILYNNYTTDDFGVYKFSHWVTDSIPKLFKKELGNLYGDSLLRYDLDVVDNINLMYNEFTNLKKGQFRFGEKNRDLLDVFFKNTALESSSQFAETYYEILDREEPVEGWLDSMILHYVDRPFNTDGFKSIPFSKPRDSTTVKILLLGDSFTIGMESEPCFNSFADILLARRYVVYNTGITGTDPAQYAAAAKEYIPLLKPDVVIVNFAFGSDFMHSPREPRPDEPHEHFTNAGWFMSNPNGYYISAPQIYELYLKLSQIPDTEHKPFNRFCSWSATGSRIWTLLEQQGVVEHPELYKFRSTYQEVEKDSTEITKEYTDRIRKLCNSHDAILINSVIPFRLAQKNRKDVFTVEKEPLDIVFGKGKYTYPKNMVDDDFFGEDDHHFNNKGYLKYANYIEATLRDTLNLDN
jgi:hypothetical protein